MQKQQKKLECMELNTTKKKKMFVLNGLTDKKVTPYITNILAKTKIEPKEVMFAQSPNGPDGYVSHLKEKRKKEIVNNTSSSCKDINHLKKKEKKEELFPVDQPAVQLSLHRDTEGAK